MIRKVDAGYVISSHHVWMPGCYESERAAQYAFRLDDAILQRLQDSVNPGGVITFAMLQAAATHTGGQGAASEGEGE